jgi:endonuclease/exonuclease/phosphatase family metal-dependent hydrolase
VSNLRLRLIAPLVFALLAGIGARALADVVTLTSGRQIEGRIVSEDEQVVRIEVKPGSIQAIDRDDIARVEKFADARSEFARKKAALEADKKTAAAAWYELALWAFGKDLAVEGKAALERTIAIDPDHADARARLGYERIGHEWVAFDEAQRRKGLVQYEGRWVRPDEKQKLEQGYVLDTDGQWVKREVVEARRAAAEEKERREREAEEEAWRRSGEQARERAETETRAATPRAEGSAPGRPGTVHVVQFNIRFDFDTDGENRWVYRAPLVAGLVQEAKAEVVCFQEDKSDQVDDLRRLLKGWEFVGKGRDGNRSEHCSIAFDTSRWSCSEHGDFWLSDTPDVVASNTWGTKYPHKVTWARLESLRDPEGARRDVLFLSTHLDEHKEADEVRQKSARLIRSWLAQHAREGNVIVCGDFNSGVEEPAHAIMIDPKPEPHLVDAWDALRRGDPNTGTCHEFTGKARKKRIDWIFTAGTASPLEIAIDHWNKDGHFPSDHFAMVATIEVAGRGKRAPARRD